MPACEKCWRDSASHEGCHAEAYARLLEARKDSPCTSEEQCGDMHCTVEYLDGSVRCLCGKIVVHQLVDRHLRKG